MILLASDGSHSNIPTILKSNATVISSQFSVMKNNISTYVTKVSPRPQRCAHAHKHFPWFVGTPEGDGGRHTNVNVTRCITASSDPDVVMMSAAIGRVQ